MKLTKKLLYKEYIKNKKDPIWEDSFMKKLEIGYTYWQLIEHERNSRTELPNSKVLYRRHLLNNRSQEQIQTQTCI